MIHLEQVVGKGKNNLYVSYYNEKGGISIREMPINRTEAYGWIHCSEDDPLRSKRFKSHLGRPIKKISKAYFNRYRKFEFMNNLPDFKKDLIFQDARPKVWSMDIENEVKDGTSETNPTGRIFTNAFCNEFGEITVQGTKKVTETERLKVEQRINAFLNNVNDPSLKRKYTLKYEYHSNEIMLLKELFNVHIPKMPLIFGWNFQKYDWRYLIGRIRDIYKYDFYLNASPTRTYTNIQLGDKYNKHIKHKIDIPYHRGIFDYMFIFEKWDSMLKYKTSINLDYIADELLGLSKVAYPGTLNDLYEKDFLKFIEYNAVDCVLPMLIHQKCETYYTMQMLANTGRVSIYEAPYASVIVANLFSDYYYHNDTIFVKDNTEPEEDTESYTGGYVMEPGVGIFDGVCIEDYESMFPSIMMMLNAGIEVYLGQTEDNGKSFMDLYGKTHELNPDKHIWSASGAVYDKTKESSMRTVISEIFGDRVGAKMDTYAIDNEVKYLKDLLKKIA